MARGKVLEYLPSRPAGMFRLLRVLALLTSCLALLALTRDGFGDVSYSSDQQRLLLLQQLEASNGSNNGSAPEQVWRVKAPLLAGAKKGAESKQSYST